MALSDGPGLVTGYCTISRKLLNYLTDYGWECHFLSHTGQHQMYLPGTTLEDGEKFNFYQHGSGQQPYCQDLIMPKIKEINPSVFGILLDTFMCYPWLLNLDFAPAKSLFYFPSDGGGGLKEGKLIRGIGCRLPLGCETILKKVDYAIAMSKYAQVQVKEIHNIDSSYIPHAVETDIYKPLSNEEKIKLRMDWSNKLGINLLNKFIIGVVARNQGRKMLDRTLFAMKKISELIPNAILFMHSDKYDAAGYFNPDVLLAEYNLQNRVIWSGTKWFKGFNYKQMNEIYNLMDVFVLGTSGEGFGIPIIEAMSCAIPVLVTDYTTTWELIERTNAGEAIGKKTDLLGNWNVGRAVVDWDDMADKVFKLYNNPELRKQYGQNGRIAVLKEYDWKIVSRQWDELLTKIANNEVINESIINIA